VGTRGSVGAARLACVLSTSTWPGCRPLSLIRLPSLFTKSLLMLHSQQHNAGGTKRMVEVAHEAPQQLASVPLAAHYLVVLQRNAQITFTLQ
jgi:hypothetical protein